MRTIGCLAVIALVIVGIILLTQSQGLTDEQKAELVGQKAHRGWNRIKHLAESAKHGWSAGGSQEPAPPPQR